MRARLLLSCALAVVWAAPSVQTTGTPFALRQLNTTDTTNVGSAAMLDNLLTFTALQWVRPVNSLASGGLIAKGTGAGSNRRSLEIRTSNVPLGLFGVVDLGTTDAASEINVMLLDQWQCVGMSYDDTAKIVKLYWGAAGRPTGEATYSFQNTGSGSPGDNSANNQFIGSNGAGNTGGNNKHTGPTALFRTILTVPQIQQWCRDPMVFARQSLGTWFPGADGAGRVIDRSGNNNHGTVTGGLPVSDRNPYVWGWR